VTAWHAAGMVLAEAVAALHDGAVERLRDLLAERPELATARVVEAPGGGVDRTLLHVLTDWPGHRPRGAEAVAVLVAAGADANARCAGAHTETPLHWAASSDDVDVLDALLDAGADIEADGAVIGGGTPLADAVAFGQWKAARRLVERGARANLWQAAALGLLDRVREQADGASDEELAGALWCACHGGQLETARYLLDRGADHQWVGWDDLTPVGAAERSGATDVVAWLRAQ